MTTYVVIGDLMMDVTATICRPIALGSDTAATLSLQAGGSAANAARWLAWSGRRTVLLGCIGRDPLGDLATQALLDAGVQPRLVITPGRTGACVVIVEPNGERTMFPDAGANTLLRPTNLPSDVFTAGDHLHLSGYTLLREASHDAGMAACHRARAAGMTISLDAASSAPILDAPGAFDESYPLLDLLLANADEAAALTGITDPLAAAHQLAERVPTVVVKNGAAGAIAVHDGSPHHAAAVDGTVADTTGAGDAFAAGLLHAWTQGADLDRALTRGHEFAALAVSRVGAGPPAGQDQE